MSLYCLRMALPSRRHLARIKGLASRSWSRERKPAALRLEVPRARDAAEAAAWPERRPLRSLPAHAVSMSLSQVGGRETLSSDSPPLSEALLPWPAFPS